VFFLHDRPTRISNTTGHKTQRALASVGGVIHNDLFTPAARHEFRFRTDALCQTLTQTPHSLK